MVSVQKESAQFEVRHTLYVQNFSIQFRNQIENQMTNGNSWLLIGSLRSNGPKRTNILNDHLIFF